MPPPTNGTCATATVMATLPYTVTIDTTLASTTTEVNPTCVAAVDNAVWWTYTNANTVHELLDVEIATSYDAGISIWTGTCGSLTEVSCTQASFDVHQVLVTFPALPATVYWVLVSDTELGAGGTLTLTVNASIIAVPTLVSGVRFGDQDETVAAYRAADGVVTGRDASPLASIPRALDRRPSDGHILGFTGSVIDYSPSLGILATTGMSDPPPPYLWTPQWIRFDQLGQLYIGWSGSSPDMAHTVLQRLHPTTFAVLQTWTDFDAGILALAGGMSVSWGTFAPDGTKCYYGGSGGGGAIQNRVYVYDLVALTESVFATYGTWSSGTGHTVFVSSMATFTNGTVAVLWHHLTSGAIDSAVVVIYGTDGTVLDTIPLLEPIASNGYRGLVVTPDDATLWMINDWPFLDAYSVATGARTAHFTIAHPGVDLVYTEGPPPGGGGPGPGPGGEPPYVPPETETDQRYIRRLRRAPHVNAENTRLFVRKFELDLERGQGLATGQGSDPIVLLRLSRDGGQTWGEEIRMQAGALGAYTQRVLARRLGHARDTVFEVTVSDPIAWSLVGAWLDIEGGTS